MQQQKGGSVDGVFVMAFATSLVFVECPSHRQYTQKHADVMSPGAVSDQQRVDQFSLKEVNWKYLSESCHSYFLLLIFTCLEVKRDTQIQCNHCHMVLH